MRGSASLTIFLSIHTVAMMFPVWQKRNCPFSRCTPLRSTGKFMYLLRMVPQAYTFCWRREENRLTEVKNLSQATTDSRKFFRLSLPSTKPALISGVGSISWLVRRGCRRATTCELYTKIIAESELLQPALNEIHKFCFQHWSHGCGTCGTGSGTPVDNYWGTVLIRPWFHSKNALASNNTFLWSQALLSTKWI